VEAISKANKQLIGISITSLFFITFLEKSMMLRVNDELYIGVMERISALTGIHEPDSH